MPITDRIRGKWRHKLDVIFVSVDEGSLQLDDYDTKFFDHMYDLVMNKGHDMTWAQGKHLSTIFDKII